MAKTILRELIIILLLCLAIILILGILLYKYVPMSKVLPEAVSYTTPEEIKKEITKTDEVQPVTYTYEVNSSDLNNYKRTQEYQPGKANPFSEISTSQSGNITNSTTSTGTQNDNTNTNNSKSNNNTDKDESSGYYPDKGTK